MNPQADAATALRAWRAEELDGASGTALFAAGLAVFTGHFPGYPLVPGVHQIAVLAALVRLALARPTLQLAAISRAKWTAPVHPGEELALVARWRRSGEDLIIDGDCRRGEQIVSTCRFALRG